MWIRAPLSIAANTLGLWRDSENRQMKLFSVVLKKSIKKCHHAEGVEVSIESRITLAPHNIFCGACQGLRMGRESS